jgi:hypothetical protein
VFVRVVRFTDVDSERMEGLLSQIDEASGPPPGVKSTRLVILADAGQSTAVVLQYFDSAEDMEESAKIFDAMDSTETPGTRASVDACEVKRELTP